MLAACSAKRASHVEVACGSLCMTPTSPAIVEAHLLQVVWKDAAQAVLSYWTPGALVHILKFRITCPQFANTDSGPSPSPPCGPKTQVTDQQEAAYLGVTLVLVSPVLFQILEFHRHVPRVHDLWRAREAPLLALPDAAASSSPEELRLLQVKTGTVPFQSLSKHSS